MMNMYTRLLFVTAFLAALAIVATTYGGEDKLYSVNYSSGVTSGYSGDPASGSKNCTNCHTGPNATVKEGWITANIPENGYLPGSTYEITVTAKAVGHTKFGFQVSPQNTGGTVLGTLVNTGSFTKLSPGSDYITHTSNGNSGNDSISWSFNWTAPPTGSGEVIFYGAFNVTNNSGSTSGDTIMLSTLAINENASTNIHSRGIESLFTVHPNPASEYLIIETTRDLFTSRYTIYDQSGKQVMVGRIFDITNPVSIHHLSSGLYFLQIEEGNGHTIKFLKVDLSSLK
jgi:hypothetical protein